MKLRKSKSIEIRVDSAMKDALDVISDREETTISEIVRSCLLKDSRIRRAYAIAKNGKKNGSH